MAGLTIQPAEGIAAFERMLVYPQLKQVIVSTGNLEQRLAQWIAPSALDSRQPQQTANGAASHVRPVWLGEYVAPRNKIEESLGKIYSELLGIEAISIYDNFFELGGHSLLATQLLSRIRTVLHTQIALNKIFEHSSIASLAEQVAALQLAGQVRLPNSTVAANGTTHLGIDIEHNIEHTDIDPNIAPSVVLHVDYEEGIV